MTNEHVTRGTIVFFGLMVAMIAVHFALGGWAAYALFVGTTLRLMWPDVKSVRA